MPQPLAGRDNVLYDGDCGICSWSAQLVGKLDSRGSMNVEPYFSYTEFEISAYGLDYEQCRDYLCVVGADGRVHRGAAAVNYVGLRLFPLSIVFALLHLFPFVLPIEAAVYHLIARNRTKISTLLGMNACKVR